MDDDKKVMICTRVSPETRKILKIIAIEQDTSTQQLMRDALKAIFKENGKDFPEE